MGAGRASPPALPPATWIGSGSIIHPDGWIVTNGHVVQPFVEQDDPALRSELIDKAVAAACGPDLDGLAADERARRLAALAALAANRDAVTITKRLQVTLSNGKMYPAQVRHYDPPAYVEVSRRQDATGKVISERGKDVAIIKIEARDLPVVKLARRSTDLNLGQTLFVIGFPGVVAAHELLSQATRFEPSVTVGRVSGFKQDVGGQRVIQTDAAIIQGNSGGPVFDERGQVIGAATFTSLQGAQVVQGFNFLIPVETLHAAAQQAGVSPQPDSEFTRLWNRGVDHYLRDLHYTAYKNMAAASAIHAGFPDVDRVWEDCQLKHREQGYLHREEVRWWLNWGGAALLALALVVGVPRGVTLAGAPRPAAHPRGDRARRPRGRLGATARRAVPHRSSRTKENIVASWATPWSTRRRRSVPSRAAPDFSATRWLAAFPEAITSSRRTRSVFSNAHSQSRCTAAVATPRRVSLERTQ